MKKYVDVELSFEINMEGIYFSVLEDRLYNQITNVDEIEFTGDRLICKVIWNRFRYNISVNKAGRVEIQYDISDNSHRRRQIDKIYSDAKELVQIIKGKKG